MGAKKKVKVVRRETVSLLTKGTRTLGVFEQNYSPEASKSRSPQSNFSRSSGDLLLAIRATETSDSDLLIGFCIVDASIGTPILG